jgi:hypothetical protein
MSSTSSPLGTSPSLSPRSEAHAAALAAIRARKRKRRSIFDRLSHSFWKRVWALLFPVGAHLLRAADRLFGPACLAWVLAPTIAGAFLRRLRDYPNFKRIRATQPLAFWRGLHALRHFLRMICHWQSAIATALLADRLREPAWAERISVTGTPPHRLPEWGQRPVIVLYLHTGGFALLRNWLRSLGLPAVSYVASFPPIVRGPWGQKIYERANLRNNLPGLAQTFNGARDLRTTVRFLVPGHILITGLDAGLAQDSATLFHAQGHEIYLSTGMVRLAASTGAILLPVSVVPRGLSRFEVRFGSPVPGSLINRDNPRPAIQHLLDQLWPDLAQDPSLLGWTTLEAMAPHAAEDHQAWP